MTNTTNGCVVDNINIKAAQNQSDKLKVAKDKVKLNKIKSSLKLSAKVNTLKVFLEMFESSFTNYYFDNDYMLKILKSISLSELNLMAKEFMNATTNDIKTKETLESFIRSYVLEPNSLTNLRSYLNNII